ncbi:MAG: DUF333 domain-containing protein [Candidatus Sericytochromatia bacterium]|nr:DUF333 domain-containing protein [Candidatus Sericytochromatia bacterium]
MKPIWISLLLLLGCTPVIVLGPTGKKSPEGTPSAAPTIANPASTFCTQHQGRLEIRNLDLGQVGVCLFTDRSHCEEWAFYRGECKPGQNFGLI